MLEGHKDSQAVYADPPTPKKQSNINCYKLINELQFSEVFFP